MADADDTSDQILDDSINNYLGAFGLKTISEIVGRPRTELSSHLLLVIAASIYIVVWINF